jgi:hypothetical protein
MAFETEGGGHNGGPRWFAEADFTETQSAQDSQIRVDGYPSGEWISRSSNTIDDVISGFTISNGNPGVDENGGGILCFKSIPR